MWTPGVRSTDLLVSVTKYLPKGSSFSLKKKKKNLSARIPTFRPLPFCSLGWVGQELASYTEWRETG